MNNINWYAMKRAILAGLLAVLMILPLLSAALWNK